MSDGLKALEAENARLLDLVQKEPATAYLEAVQRATDERLTYLKHAERKARARADRAEHQLAKAQEALKWYAGDGSTYDGIDIGQRARSALQDIAAESKKQ